MKCADCGQEGFPNVAAVTKHKAECPGRRTETDETQTGTAPELTMEQKREIAERLASELGLALVDPNAPKEPVIDVSHLPKDTLAGLHRNAELKFEVLGVLDDKNLLHVHDVRYPRRGR